MSTATTTAEGVRLTQMPKVDLLPPEIAEEAKFRTLRLGLGFAVVLSVAVVGLLWYSANSSVAGAQDDLTAAQVQQTQLQKTAATFADVPAAYASVQAAQAELTAAMGKEIRFSFVLSDLSITIPDRVWVTNVAITEDVDGNAPPVGSWGDTGVARLAVQGVAYRYPDVAAWLEMFGHGKYYTDPYFSDAHAGALINDKPNVIFSTDTIISKKALSGRYDNGSTR